MFSRAGSHGALPAAPIAFIVVSAATGTDTLVLQQWPHTAQHLLAPRLRVACPGPSQHPSSLSLGAAEAREPQTMSASRGESFLCV